MTRQDASILINLDSRRARAVYRQLEEACLDAGIDIKKVYEIDRKISLKTTVGRIKRDKPGLLIIGGGDGTVSRALSFLAGSPVEIGIVPLGTTNNFARSLGLPLTIEESVSLIANSKSHPVDLGKVGGRYFGNIVGIGISALIADKVSGEQKRRWGRFAYAYEGLKQLVRHKPFYVTLTDKDNELTMHFQTHQIIVANGRFHAGKEIAKDAHLNSKELVVFPIGGKSRINFIFRMLDFYLGSRKSVRHSSYLIARDIKIHTSRPQVSEVDGEMYKSTPLRFKVAPGMVKIRFGRVA